MLNIFRKRCRAFCICRFFVSRFDDMQFKLFCVLQRCRPRIIRIDKQRFYVIPPPTLQLNSRPGIEHKHFILKLFRHPDGIQAIFRDIPPKSLFAPGFEDVPNLLAPILFMWKTPIPLEDIRTQTFEFVLHQLQSDNISVRVT